jgi:hypothetical protein
VRRARRCWPPSIARWRHGTPWWAPGKLRARHQRHSPGEFA